MFNHFRGLVVFNNGGEIDRIGGESGGSGELPEKSINGQKIPRNPLKY